MALRLSASTAVLVALCAAAGAQPPGMPRLPPQESNPAGSVVSTTRRFAVSGLTAGENVALAASADEVADRVESIIGAPLPFARVEVLRIVAETSGDAGSARVILGQGWADRQMAQRLVIVRPEEVDQEDVLEGLCWLLLNRYVISRQDVEQRERHLGSVPDWWSVGLAQNLYAALRARNAETVVRRWKQGGGLSVPEILELESIPEGRWEEKAFAGVWVAWLASLPDRTRVFRGLIGPLVAGEKITMDRLFRPDLLGMTPVQIEKNWDLWIAQQSQVRRIASSINPDRVSSLELMRTVRPLDLGFPENPDMPVELTLDELIAHSRQQWMPLLASALSLKVKGLGIGEPPKFRQAVDSYGAFFDALRARSVAGWFTRLTFRAPTENELRRQLDRAEQAFSELLAQMADADATVGQDGDREEPGAGMGSPTAVTPPPMDRSMPREERLRYIERIREQRTHDR